MPRFSEDQLDRWTAPASDTEEQQAERTRRQIVDALRASPRLPFADLDIHAKGSYPNNTNVVRDSDVDIAVEFTGIVFNGFFHDAAGMTLADTDWTPYSGAYPWANLKDDVEAALASAFGRCPSDTDHKAIHIEEGATTLPADVVPVTRIAAGSRAHSAVRPRITRGHKSMQTTSAGSTTIRVSTLTRASPRTTGRFAATSVLCRF